MYNLKCSKIGCRSTVCDFLQGLQLEYPFMGVTVFVLGDTFILSLLKDHFRVYNFSSF